LTKNAFNQWHSAGGSSGGEGALIGSGAMPVGLGSDIGGSIRMPCVFNGIAGHKATGGLTQENHHWPLVQPTKLAPFCGYGPMAKRIDDVIHIFEHMNLNGKTKPVSEVNTKKLKVYYYDELPGFRTSREMKENINKVISGLKDDGHEVEALNTDAFEKAFLIWNTLICQLGPNFSLTLGGGKKLNLANELLQFVKLKPRIILPNILQIAFAQLGILQGDLSEMQSRLLKLKTFINDHLGQNGILIAPAYNTAAPINFWPLIANQEFTYAGIYNVLEHPATAINTGFSKSTGLPLGVQVIAHHHNDHLTLAMAKRLEEKFGGWAPPQ
jgi:fatty acid amide hydrolase 2